MNPFGLYAKNIFKTPDSPLSNWPQFYYPPLTQAFNSSSHFIALIKVSRTSAFPSHLKGIIPLRAKRTLPLRKIKTWPYPHMPKKCPFYLFVEVVGQANQYPVWYFYWFTCQASTGQALAKCSVKGNTAQERGQTRDLHIAYQDKRLTKSLPRQKLLNGKTAEGKKQLDQPIHTQLENTLHIYTHSLDLKGSFSK